MVIVNKIKVFVLEWKKTFIGGVFVFILTVISISTGIIKIYEKLDAVISNEGPAEIPIRKHITFQTNRILRAINKKDAVFIKKLIDTVKVVSVKQIPSKK